MAAYKMMMRALVQVTLLTAFVCIITYVGVFDKVPSVQNELGFHHYAEHWNSTGPNLRKSKSSILPKWFKMPANTVVNIGYVLVGAYWCAVTTDNVNDGIIQPIDGFMFYFFNMMSIIYAPMQAMRILSQLHRFAVLDQWYTFPLFAWAFVWENSIISEFRPAKCWITMAISVLSYFSVLFIYRAFEACLFVHMAFVLFGAISLLQRYPCQRARPYFILTLLCSIGFVVLKLLDLHLASVHPVFNKISGHFLSKLCDIGQIHYANHILLSVTLHKYTHPKLKAE